MRYIFATAIIFTSLSTSVFAKDKCEDPEDQATLNECADASFRVADKKLNDFYRAIEGRLKDYPDMTKKFVQAQREWIKFRDAECQFQISSGGTVAPMNAAICANILTDDRIKDFDNYLHCEEGDTSCPVPSGK